MDETLGDYSEEMDRGLNPQESNEHEPLLSNGDGRASCEATPGELAATNASQLPWYKRPSIWIMLPPFAFYCTAIGGILVPKITLILTLICRQYFADKQAAAPALTPIHIVLGGDDDECKVPEISALVSTFSLYMNLITGFFAAIVSPKLGSLSDRYGRKKVIIYASLGSLVSEAFSILCYHYPDTFSYRWLLLGSFTEGLTGSFLLAMAVTGSYLADITLPAQRAGAFGLLHGVLFFGIGIGPTLGGWVVEATGKVVTPFYLSLGAHVCFLLYIYFILPESLSIERQMLAREKHAKENGVRDTQQNRWKTLAHSLNILEPLKILWPTGRKATARLRLNLVILATIDFIMFGVGFGGMTVLVLYATVKFKWDTLHSGYFVTSNSISRSLGLIIVLPLLIRLFQRKSTILSPSHKHHGCDPFDLYILRFALTLEVTGYTLYLLAQHPLQFMAGGAIASFGGMGSPTLQSALTKHVPIRSTGQLLGAVALLHSLARLAAPILFNTIYTKTAATFPQTVFVVLSGIYGIGFAVSWLLKANVSFADDDNDTHEGDDDEAGVAERAE